MARTTQLCNVQSDLINMSFPNETDAQRADFATRLAVWNAKTDAWRVQDEIDRTENVIVWELLDESGDDSLTYDSDLDTVAVLATSALVQGWECNQVERDILQDLMAGW